MSKPSQDRLRYSKALGRLVEQKFTRSATDLGFDVLKSSISDDVKKHIDFYLFYNGEGGWGVDVKGKNTPTEIWCEFKNVKGMNGWMYGDAHLIAFDMPSENGFCIVDREELLQYCLRETTDTKVEDKKNAYKNRYTRKGRKDEITMMKLEDISSLSSYRVWDYSVEDM